MTKVFCDIADFKTIKYLSKKKYFKIFNRTKNISSSKLRKKIQKNIDLIF